MDWFGQIPVHWEVVPLKRLLARNDSGAWGDEGSSIDTPVIRSTEISLDGTWNLADPARRKFSKREYETTRLLAGDLLVTKSSGSSAHIGKTGLVNAEIEAMGASFSNFMQRLRVDALHHPAFYYYLLNNNVGREQLDYLSSTTTGLKNLNASILGELLVVSMPHLEQEALARYLAEKTAEIDGIIEKKGRLIKLLEEERAAAISTAVTQGLDPDVPKRPSGIPWLGDIPAHWDTAPIKFVVATPVTDGPHETPEFLSDGVPFISAEAIKNNRIDFSRKRGYISSEDHEKYSRKYKPERGDIYLVKSGATTGSVARVETDEEFNIWSPLAAIRANTQIVLSDYVFYFMQSVAFHQAVELSWNFGTQQNIGMGVIENISTAVPPLDEQTAIALYLDQKTSQIDLVRVQTVEQINLLQEYRTAVISQVVTGKIDVREEVAE